MRHSAADFILGSGIRHLRDLRWTSFQVGRCTSPNRQAVSATYRRHVYKETHAGHGSCGLHFHDHFEALLTSEEALG